MRANAGLARTKRDDEYSLLYQATGIGAVIGSYRDQPIHETLIDEFDQTYSYLGLAPRRADGSFDGDAIAPGEYVFLPGLLYRRDHRGSLRVDAALSRFRLNIS